MLLYKYRSIDELWFTLDIILNNRVRCSKWDVLNDPLEGRYEAFFDSHFVDIVNRKRDEWRICALSKSINSFLLWSHYADGHKGVAIEIDIPEELTDLVRVRYSPFSPLFTQINESNREQRHLFELKTEEWKYEEEYRIICKDDFFKLPNVIRRIHLGPKVPEERVAMLKSILPSQVELVRMKIDRIQGKVVPSTA